jgi:hypothetical protein
MPSGSVRFLTCWHWRVAPQARPAGLHQRAFMQVSAARGCGCGLRSRVRRFESCWGRSAGALTDCLVVRPLSWPFPDTAPRRVRRDRTSRTFWLCHPVTCVARGGTWHLNRAARGSGRSARSSALGSRDTGCVRTRLTAGSRLGGGLKACPARLPAGCPAARKPGPCARS